MTYRMKQKCMASSFVYCECSGFMIKSLVKENNNN